MGGCLAGVWVGARARHTGAPQPQVAQGDRHLVGKLTAPCRGGWHLSARRVWAPDPQVDPHVVPSRWQHHRAVLAGLGLSLSRACGLDRSSPPWWPGLSRGLILCAPVRLLLVGLAPSHWPKSGARGVPEVLVQRAAGREEPGSQACRPRPRAPSARRGRLAGRQGQGQDPRPRFTKGLSLSSGMSQA